MRLFLSFVTSIITALLLVSCIKSKQIQSESLPHEATQPNIIIIFVDDMGYADINSFNNADLQTPSLDSMAEEGALFTNFYVAQLLVLRY